MFFNRYWFAFKFVLVILGVIWCAAIARRWREDVATVRNPPEPVDRTIVLGFWVVTAGIAVLLTVYGIGVVGEFFRVLTDW